MRGCPSGRFCLGGGGSTPRGGRGLLRGVVRVMRPDEEGEVSCDVGLDLEVIGPFSWIPESSDAPPRIFDAPESRKCGVYLFTVSTAEGFLIYWAGQTSQPVRTRLATHSREFLAGTYNVLDVSHLCEGKRTVLWKGLWWRKDSCERYEEYLLCAGRVAPLTLAQLRSTPPQAREVSNREQGQRGRVWRAEEASTGKRARAAQRSEHSAPHSARSRAGEPVVTTSVHLADLRRLSDEERSEKLKAVARATRNPPNREVRQINLEIRTHEDRFGFSSDELRRRLAAGEQRETDDVCRWLMLLALRERVEKALPR